MGLDQSRPLSDWGCEEVATEVASLGHQYCGYCDSIMENSVDGSLLLSLSPAEIRETLDDLDINNRLHRRVIEKKLLALIKAAGNNNTTRSSQVYLIPRGDSGSCAESRDEETSRTEEFDSSDSSSEPLSPEEEERKRIMAFMDAAQEQQIRERDALVARESALTNQIQRLYVQQRSA